MASSNKHLQRGFTLIEALISIAIIALLAVVGVANLAGFQKEVRLESFASEFVSALKTAKNKSVNAEVPAGVSGFDSYTDDDTLPFWVVKTDSNKYEYYSIYKLESDVDYTSSVSETVLIPSGSSILPNTEIGFERLTGKTLETCFTIQVSGYSVKKYLLVNANGDMSEVDVCT